VGSPVYIVLSDGPLILGAYTKPSPAHVHGRTITGASVVMVELLDRIPDSVLELLGEDFEDDDTPVTEIPFDDLKTPSR
jgi:hypothetical protein